MNCQVCKRKESHQFSSMCQDCIDRGWRVKGKDDGYYNVNYHKQRLVSICPKIRVKKVIK